MHAPLPESPGATEIVVAEDHPLQADLLKRLLEGSGYTVRLAANGRVALEAVRRRRPAMVISDVRMLEMDGYALCRAIRGDEALHDLPVMLVTSLAGVEDIALALECGADNFVRKPYDQKALLSRVSQLLANANAKARGAADDPRLPLAIGDSQYTINSSRRQILDLLVSAYEEALRLNAELQRRQEEVLALNAALERGAGQLHAANRELEAFSYSVSHDLRAPLQVIDGFSLALVERHAQRLDPKGLHYLQRIRDNAQQMNALIEGLLSLGQIARTQALRTPVDLSELATHVIAECRERDPAAGVKVKVQAGLWAEGDPRLLKQVLANLIGNAWKFASREAQPCIEFVGHSMEKEDATIFSVRDNGVGFDMAHADKLFSPFQRLHPASEFPGTGVGLATVRRIVELHGGRVWAEAAPGMGASFHFTLAASTQPDT
ncbi:sensor histidine kinase [Caenimonas soli]|uniref:sensor histidine kinase n=1 Tax=Caenimonas soli TaxID=2735555 RepID=UPI00155251A3|nr:response regulator [Caenimonas soli]NPC58160.1 response regulator [Caenimonas soli]